MMKPIDAITITQLALSNNCEDWVGRYSKYLKGTLQYKHDIAERRSKFHICGGLSVYSNISKAYTNSSSFDIRCQGQSVGEIKVKKDGGVCLNITDTHTANNKKYFTGYPQTILSGKDIAWNSSIAKAFRQFFSKSLTKSGHPEHRFENLLLKEFRKSCGYEKSLTQIQPVTLVKDVFFQMPTPLTASRDEIKYASNKGGGIDILARYKHHLTVIELKDEYKPSEGPDKVIVQALAYATFIVELSKTEYGDLFWELCGIRDPKNKQLINVCILMPDPNDGSIPSFAGDEIDVPNSDFRFKLQYMYFDKETVKITRTSL